MGTDYRIVKVQLDRPDFKFLELVALRGKATVEQLFSEMIDSVTNVLVRTAIDNRDELPVDIVQAALEIEHDALTYQLILNESAQRIAGQEIKETLTEKPAETPAPG
jgi:hypothetical protein